MVWGLGQIVKSSHGLAIFLLISAILVKKVDPHFLVIIASCWLKYGKWIVFTCIYLHSQPNFTWFSRDKCVLTLQRGVTSTARHSENATCCGVTSTARHAALSHVFDYISTTKGKNVIRMWSCPMHWRMFQGIPHQVSFLIRFYCIFEKLRHS